MGGEAPLERVREVAPVVFFWVDVVGFRLVVLAGRLVVPDERAGFFAIVIAFLTVYEWYQKGYRLERCPIVCTTFGYLKPVASRSRLVGEIVHTIGQRSRLDSPWPSAENQVVDFTCVS